MDCTTHLFGLKLQLHNNAALSLVIAVQSIFSELTKILGMLLIPPIAYFDMRNDYLYSCPSALFYILFQFIYK